MMFRRMAWQGLGVFALGTLFASLPVHGVFKAAGGFGLSVDKAYAKDGGDDGGDGGNNSGSGGGNRGGSGGGGSSGSGGGGSSGHGDSGRGGGSGSGGNDDKGGGGGDDGGIDDNGGGRSRSGGAASDDNGGSRRGADDRRTTTAGGNASAAQAGLRVVKFERTRNGVEVVYSNGIKEEIENGRFEMKNAAGRTVAERPATQKDLARLDANARNSGISAFSTGSRAATVEIAGGDIEITYNTGWKEELASGQYELKDPNNNTVVQRPATAADIQRLRGLAGS